MQKYLPGENMELARTRYLNELIQRKHNGSIKIVTGIRRCGKSYLLFNLFCRHLLESGISEDHIIRIELDNPEFKECRDPEILYARLKESVRDTKMHYILLDEIQLVPGFEEVLTGLLYLKNVDIYVTGSNSKFLSKDVVTGFRGRGDEVHLYPAGFAEFLDVYQGNRYDAWTDYITYGGLPGVILRETHAQKVKYLTDLFKETYLIDIIERNHIRNDAELGILIDILSSAVGSLTNPNRIRNTFQSVGKSKITATTIASYLTCLEDAFLITSAHRYDIRGRNYIGSPLKYYFEDVGLRNARLNFRQQEENYLMENVIFNELRMRGYSVDVGVVERSEKGRDGKYQRKYLEIDFVANQGNKRYYIQSAMEMASAEKIRQEKKSLQNVGDNFKKIIVVRDIIKPKCDKEGILTMSIYDFLEHTESLDW